MLQGGTPKLGQIDEDELMNFDAPWSIRIMIGYLYFVQGFLLAIPGTVPYVYPNLPDYLVLSVFSLSTLPFSLKFLTAPILQKYTNIRYGKRKTWIIISQSLTNIMVFISSFFTNQNQAELLAILLIFLFIGVSLQDISLDALCLKQLRNTKMMSVIQAACQSTGIILGGLILLKSTSLQFANKLGFQSAFLTLRELLIIVTIFLFIPNIIIHFWFKESYVEAEIKSTKKSLFQVYNIYKYFFKKQYRYCRILIFALIYFQGFNFFTAGYGYQLIERGFSRDTMNTIDNLQNIVTTALVFFVGMYTNVLGFSKTVVTYMVMIFIILVYLWSYFPTSVVQIAVTNFLLAVLSQWDFLVMTQLVAYFPEMGTTGMLYTMGASGLNLGKNMFIHTALLKKIQWKYLAIVGIGIQVPIILFIPKMMGLIESGETSIQILQEKQDNLPIAGQIELVQDIQFKNNE